jgi:hypothetical protein
VINKARRRGKVPSLGCGAVNGVHWSPSFRKSIVSRRRFDESLFLGVPDFLEDQNIATSGDDLVA